MPNFESSIQDYKKITDIFGSWPSFHDAEVIEVSFVRGSVGSEGGNWKGPGVTFKIHIWEMTSEIDPKGYYVMRNHFLIIICFEGIQKLEMDGFNHQNVIMDLTIEPIKAELVEFKVMVNPSYGISASFKCSSIRVCEVLPCDGNGTSLA